ncbi:MAG: hypothetical protein AAAC47_08920 [Pararhizobium sp.]
MKSQQRKFVVEFKSRRRLTMRPDSIWADTDLKALVREAEAEAPHPFEPYMISKTPGQDSELPTDPGPETHLDDNAETEDDRQISTSSVEAEQTYYPPQQSKDLTFSSVPQLKEESSGRRSPVAKHRREANVSGYADGRPSVPSVRSTAAQVEAPSDELVALDEENRRLKGLLAKHLLQQNMQLRKMLARFGVI